MASDFGAGCVGGAAGVLVGQPFDTVKVRLQVQHADRIMYNGVFDCVKKIIKQESFRSLFKGMTPPLLGLAFQNAIIFGVQGQLRKFLEPSLKNEMLAGAVTGATQAVITGPIELAKIRLQIQGTGGGTSSLPPKYTGAIQTVLKIHQEEGFRAVFRGTAGVLARDIPGTTIYFGSFMYINELLAGDHDDGTDSLTVAHLLLSGGCAGILSWALNYPIDVIKTRVQAEGFAPHGKYTSYHDCIVKSLRSEGLGSLFRGYNATMLRAFPVNAAILATVTQVLRWVNKDEGGGYQGD